MLPSNGSIYTTEFIQSIGTREEEVNSFRSRKEEVEVGVEVDEEEDEEEEGEE